MLVPHYRLKHLPVFVGIVIRETAAVFFVHQMGGEHKVRRGAVTGDGDIPDYGDSEKRLDVRIVRHWFQRIPEENHKIDFAQRYLGAQLLIAAQRAAFHLVNRDAQFLFDYSAGGSGGVDFVIAQFGFIELDPFQQIGFFIIVCD